MLAVWLESRLKTLLSHPTGQPEDYEQVLASLALDIQKRQTRLSEIRLRERRSTLLFSLYALALWVAYVSLWYTDMVPTLSSHPRSSSFEKWLEGAPVYIGPIVILFIRRIAQIWYTRIGNAEEKQLITLRKQQREKIEEIKKKTNYYSTRTLIERYDEGSGTETPLRRRIPRQVPPGTPAATPQRTPAPQPPRLITPQTPSPNPTPVSANLQQQLSPSPQRPMPPPRKQWYDKLADAILGDDDSASAAASRYALICQKCFAHNGLVKESLWEDTPHGALSPPQSALSPVQLAPDVPDDIPTQDRSPSHPESEFQPEPDYAEKHAEAEAS
ncbi:hypothetical protein NM688_g7755 [Phlebia brevispora]|uniref:Uncharacterized protein n=1 Tax=Phlebia brevispora TaxID=194682 RepID=A0ACC1S1G2_9APHY|nr:hypothetical protein NM688_g7755 [Phlebia brevispora]